MSPTFGGVRSNEGSQKDRITWNRITKLADRILHPWPHARFAVKHPRWEPSALMFCAGALSNERR
jgi:RNA-directed DNA polymerase